MKRVLSPALLLTLCVSGLVPPCAVPASAQEVASVGNIGQLREQYERLLAVERDPATTPEVREVNQTFLAERRAQLASALRVRIAALSKYRDAVAGTLGDAERHAVAGSIQRLVEELQALQPPAAPPPSFAPAARPARRASRATKAAPAARPAPVVEASYAAEPRRAEPVDAATRPEPAPAEPRQAAAIEITSPARDKVVRVAEVEVEVSVSDEEIDDLMVAVYTPASEKPKTARTYELRRSDRGVKTIPIALSRGENRVEVSDLKRGEVKAARTITFTPPETPVLNAAAAAFVTPAPAPQTPAGDAERQNAPIEYDWGRVRAYFTAGMIFSKEREEFSKSDMALSFVLDKNYIKSRRWNLNTFFEARLTSVPVAARTPEPEGEDGGEEDEETDQFDAFITSKKAGFAQAGVYLPLNITAWRNQREMNTLFVAPLAKGGVMTITGDRRTAEAETFGDDDVFNFYSFGVRLGHFRYPRLRRPCSDFPRDDNCDSFADYAPELISWLDITMGRWENFELVVPTGQLDTGGNPITTRQRRWRYQAEGRLKIPETPFLVGFDGNFGQGPDDLRFGFGMRFDIARVIHRLKLQEFLENAPAQPPANNNNNNSGGGTNPPND